MPREGSRVTDAVIVALPGGDDRGVFIFGFDDLFFAPIVVPAVIVQRDHGRRGKLRAPRNKKVRGHGDIRRGMKSQFLANVVAFVHALHHLWFRLAWLRSIYERGENFLSAFHFPRFQVFGAAIHKRQALARSPLFLLDEWIKVAESRALPSLALIRRKTACLRGRYGARGCDRGRSQRPSHRAH